MPRNPSASPMPAKGAASAASISVSDVWAPEPPHGGDVWTPRPWVHPEERRAEGKRARQAVPRRSQVFVTPLPAIVSAAKPEAASRAASSD